MLHTLYRALRLLPFFVVPLIISCSNDGHLAPVVESSWRGHVNAAETYVVLSGDTLYSIAFRYDLDYRQLAALNHLYAPYRLQVGQRLHTRIKSFKVSAAPAPVIQKVNPPVTMPIKSNQISPQATNKIPFMERLRPASSQNSWYWPVEGKLASHFSPQNGKKGINIAGKKGEKIRAAKKGVVAYAGSGLNGYGNLIIIKHDDQFLTAYGNNARNLVSEGQSVRAGQEIAQMGMVDRRYWGVHFEIRQRGQPINPLNVLPR